MLQQKKTAHLTRIQTATSNFNSFCFQSLKTEKVKIDEAVSMSLASDSLETIEVLIKCGTVTASDMIIHRVLITILTFIQGHKRSA